MAYYQFSLWEVARKQCRRKSYLVGRGANHITELANEIVVTRHDRRARGHKLYA